MVTITNGVKTFRVTAGAVKTYESMGFHVAAGEQVEEMSHTTQEHSNDSGVFESAPKGVDRKDTKDDVGDKDDVFIEELLEKPLSQWNNEEIKEFVRIKDIDTSGAQKVSQVRSIIKSYLEEEQKKNA